MKGLREGVGELIVDLSNRSKKQSIDSIGKI